MWKIAFCLLVLLVCLEISVAKRNGKGKHGAKKWKKLSKKYTELKDNKDSDNQHPWKSWKGKGGENKKKDYTKMSNPEMMMMMRMKKMLGPLRQLFTKVLDLGPRGSIDGHPDFCGDNECPDFTVLNKSTHYELRHYHSSHWVSTSVVASSWTSKSQQSLFWPLFKYIQGANQKGQKIKMTVPVTTLIKPDPSSDGMNYTMSFFLPSSIGVPPMPKSDEVFVNQKKDFKVYVHSFKGFAWGEEIWEKHVDMMQKHLDKDGISYHPRDQMYLTAGYDDPMKLFNRHNEVWLVAKD